MPRIVTPCARSGQKKCDRHGDWLQRIKKLKLRELHVITITGKAFYEVANAPADHSNRCATQRFDLDTGRLFVRRLKGSLSTSQPLEGDEIRALRAWLRQRIKASCCNSPLVFLSERGPMTRQAFNYLRGGWQARWTEYQGSSAHAQA
jgi:integrase